MQGYMLEEEECFLYLLLVFMYEVNFKQTKSFHCVCFASECGEVDLSITRFYWHFKKEKERG